jgi:hypothetical protein
MGGKTYYTAQSLYPYWTATALNNSLNMILQMTKLKNIVSYVQTSDVLLGTLHNKDNVPNNKTLANCQIVVVVAQ